jgi:uncharacterized repeat protein (TIGR01451 family)
MKKIAIAAAVMLLGSSGAWALTLAGTNISNSASLTYSAGGVDQTDGGNNPVTSNADEFVVDKKIDFTLTNDDGDQVTSGVVPGASDRITTWTLVNTGNMDQNFTLSSANLTNNEEIYSDADTAGKDTGTQEIWYSTDNGASWTQYTANSLIEIKGDHSGNTAQDRTLKIQVRSDIPTTVSNGDILNISLTAKAVKSDGTKEEEVNAAGTGDATGADRQSEMDTILAESDHTSDTGSENNTIRNAETIRFGGYKVTTAVLDLTKTSCVLEDPVNGQVAAAKRIPGATLTYVLDINNTGTADATDITVTDDLVSELDGTTIANVRVDTNATSCSCSYGTPSNNGTAGTNSGNGQQVKVENIEVGASKHTCVTFEVDIK